MRIREKNFFSDGKGAKLSARSVHQLKVRAATAVLPAILQPVVGIRGDTEINPCREMREGDIEACEEGAEGRGHRKLQSGARTCKQRT